MARKLCRDTCRNACRDACRGIWRRIRKKFKFKRSKDGHGGPGAGGKASSDGHAEYSDSVSSEKRHSPDAARHVSNAAGKLIIDDAWDEKASREFQTPPIGELWRLAIDKLAESTRQMLLVGDSEHVPLQQQIEELIGMAKMMEKKCDEKSWKFTIGGRKIILRDYAAILVSYLRSVDNIAILVAQTQASVAWSAVKFIMQIPVSSAEEMYAVLGSTNMIVSILNRGQIYELVYECENTEGPALNTLLNALVDLYSAVLETLADLLTLLSKNTAAQALHIIAHPGAARELSSTLDELDARLSREVRGYQFAASELQADLLHHLQTPSTRVDVRVLSFLETVDEKEHQEILEWISPVKFVKNHTEVQKSRTRGTGEWLLRHDNFREWERTSSSVILWLQGSAGTGKTFLTSRVIDHVQGDLTNTKNHEGFAYFYCNQNEKARRSPLSVLQSYVRQLSNVAHGPDKILANLRKTCSETKKRGSDLSFDDCKQLLLDAINIYPRTTLVLDALDELDECASDSSTRVQLIETMKTLLTEAKRPLKIFISSRPDHDNWKKFRTLPNIEVYTKENQVDIAKFLEAKVKKEEWSDAVLEEIKKTLLNHSEGMFQWVDLQVKQILKCPTETAAKNRLRKLPDGLKATYDEIYGEIEQMNENDKALANRAFMWVMCAYTPLSSVELLSAICLDAEQDATDLAGKITESYLQELCNKLLVLDSQEEVWRFSHLSVAEYFESIWGLQRAHGHAAKVCLKVLIETYKTPISPNRVPPWLNKPDSKSVSKPRDISDLAHPFQVYVRNYWAIHVRAYEHMVTGEEVDPKLAGLLKSFLGSPHESSDQYRGWYDQVTCERWWNEARGLSPKSAAVLIMCRFSVYHLLRDWWTDLEKIKLYQTNDKNESLLTIAVVEGCKPICATIVERGIPIDTMRSTGSYGSALAAAAYWGRAEIVEYLVEKGAQPDLALSDGEFGSALAAAACGGQIQIVEFLIENGAQPDLVLSTGEYGSALAAAISKGEIEVIGFLISQGADPDLLLSTGVYGSALAAAASANDIVVVEFLVEEGAEPDLVLSVGRFGSALAAAASEGDMEIVEFLIEKGAEPNLVLTTGEFGSALAAAACRGRFEIVEFLIERGAEPNLVLSTGQYGSALAAAAAVGEIDIVELLVEKGAQPNLALSTGKYGSALTAAASATVTFKKEIEVVEFLVEKGAEPNLVLSVGQYGSALAAAAYWRRPEMVRYLVENGAEPDLVLLAGEYGSALTAAAAAITTFERETKVVKSIVEFLVENGAQPNRVLSIGKYGSALAAAAYRGRIEVVEFLIEKGAQPDLVLPAGKYGSAIAAATSGGQIDIFKKGTKSGHVPSKNGEAGPNVIDWEVRQRSDRVSSPWAHLSLPLPIRTRPKKPNTSR